MFWSPEIMILLGIVFISWFQDDQGENQGLPTY